MMDWTDRHCRYFMRLLSPSVRLYTEMVTAAAIRYGDAGRLLHLDASEHPVALQIGGNDPRLMAHVAKCDAAKAYDEININVGCPSDRVRSGVFGACLMLQPATVADCIKAMQDASSLAVTVKTRIGIEIDGDARHRCYDSDGFLHDFVAAVAEAGCTTLIVHARIAVLGGLSPKDNRRVPPLDYERVYRLKEAFPGLGICLNGGITTLAQVRDHLRHVDAVMVGRQAYQAPWFLTELEALCSRPGQSVLRDRVAVVEQMLPYIEQELQHGCLLKHVTRHMLGLFAGQPGARAWRRYLSEHAHRPGAGPEVLEQALRRQAQAAASAS